MWNAFGRSATELDIDLRVDSRPRLVERRDRLGDRRTFDVRTTLIAMRTEPLRGAVTARSTSSRRRKSPPGRRVVGALGELADSH